MSEKEELPDFSKMSAQELKEHEDAAHKIQAAIRGKKAKRPNSGAQKEAPSSQEEKPTTVTSPKDDSKPGIPPPSKPVSNFETTLALVKPDAFTHREAIKLRILSEGFTVLQESVQRLDATSAELFYAEHQGKPFFADLVSFMSSGPILALILAKQNAISECRKLIGPTNPQNAKQSAPNSIRAQYGNPVFPTLNAAHGSDSRESAEREIRFFFPNESIFPDPSPEDTASYIQRAILPVLNEGLIELCRQKPADPVIYLSNWLLAHNPHKPIVQEPTRRD